MSLFHTIQKLIYIFISINLRSIKFSLDSLQFTSSNYDSHLHPILIPYSPNPHHIITPSLSHTHPILNHRNLLKLFMEIYYWERMNFEIPHYASEAYTKSDDLRSQRENVLLVVRDYNRIVFALSAEERELFKERIRSLDKKIYPGLTKLTWVAKGVSEYFLNECRIFAGKVGHPIVERLFKFSNC